LDFLDIEREMRRRQVGKAPKKPRNTNNNYNNNNYDLLDDVEILPNDQIEEIHRKASLTSKNVAPKQKRVAKTTSGEQITNHRTNEVILRF
jgi:hypothetical protein